MRMLKVRNFLGIESVVLYGTLMGMQKRVSIRYPKIIKYLVEGGVLKTMVVYISPKKIPSGYRIASASQLIHTTTEQREKLNLKTTDLLVEVGDYYCIRKKNCLYISDSKPTPEEQTKEESE